MATAASGLVGTIGDNVGSALVAIAPVAGAVVGVFAFVLIIGLIVNLVQSHKKG